MQRRQFYILLALIILIGVTLFGYRYQRLKENQPAVFEESTDNKPTEPTKLIKPIADLENRITKKPFGIFVKPGNSPVDPERFTGYHTAVDIEYGDIASDIPVYAIADGKVVVSRANAQGYGGLIAIRHTINNKPVVALYGHLDPSSIPQANTDVIRGEKVGILGDAYSPETDGERKHLHFGVLKINETDLRGYVQNQSELSRWYDPIAFLNGDI